MRSAITVFILGIALVAGSWVPFGLAIKRSFDAEAAFVKSPVSVGTDYTSSLIEVDPSDDLQVAVKLDLHSQSIRKNASSDSDPYSALYSFPFTYTVSDESGRSTHTQSTFIAWDRGSRSYDRDDVSEQRGHVVVESSLQKFAAPESGRVRLAFRLSPDEVHDVVLNDASVTVYHRVYRHAPTVITGIAMVVGGFLVAGVGGIMLLVRAASSSDTAIEVAEGAPAPPVAHGKRSRDAAMWCHLSSFSGFFVPFGGLIGPIVIWALFKDDDAFVNQHGIAAINFRISMYIYSMACFVLVFVFIGIMLLLAIGLLDIVLTVIAAVSASKGETYRYPFSLPLIRGRPSR